MRRRREGASDRRQHHEQQKPVGACPALALGAGSGGEGDLVGAEREFAYALWFFADQVPRVNHNALLVWLADVRVRRGRVDQVDVTLRRARDELVELAASGMVPPLAAGSERFGGRGAARATEIFEAPSEAELAVLRLLSGDLWARQVGAELCLSPNTVRSGSHTRAIYRKLGVRSRAAAVARANALGLLGNTLTHLIVAAAAKTEPRRVNVSCLMQQ